MSDSSEALVLRSVNLPVRMDDHLRGLAYALKCSKSDLIRAFVLQGLHDAYGRIDGRLDEACREREMAWLHDTEQHRPLPDRLPFEIGPGTQAQAQAQARRPARERYSG